MCFCTSCAYACWPSSLSLLGFCLLHVLLVHYWFMTLVWAISKITDYRLAVCAKLNAKAHKVPSRAICADHTYKHMRDLLAIPPVCMCVRVCVVVVATQQAMQLIVAIFNFELWPAISHWMQINTHIHMHTCNYCLWKASPSAISICVLYVRGGGCKWFIELFGWICTLTVTDTFWQLQICGLYLAALHLMQ